ncbi:MAG: nitronate monooxygenase [Sneathiella sp.]|nr:nitronate monooxygenase [Sneathiella sp.]
MNRVLQHTGSKYPVIQAPMGWIARSPLASAVCNAGGLGIIETSSGETENCIREIEKMRELTDAPFGINLPLLFLRDENMIKFVAECGVKFVTTSAGNPAKLIEILKAHDIIVYHAVPTVKSALKAVEAGVDGLIVEGSEGGGFKNPEEVSTLVLLQAIRDHVDVPMVAAAFAVGAEAVQMGTRLVSCKESPVHPNYKQAIIDAEDTGTYVLNKKSTPCIRALKTERTSKIFEEGLMPADTFKHIQDLYFGGDMEASVGLAGQSASLIKEQKSAADVVDETIKGFWQISSRMGSLASSSSF